MRRRLLACCLWAGLTLAYAVIAWADGLAEIPPALVPWQGFALHGVGQELCPPDGNEAKARVCLFPTSLALAVDASGADFTLRVRLFHEGAVPLPHGQGVWIVRASLGGKDLPVVAGEAGPSVWLGPGESVIEGRLGWNAVPAGLALPPDVGLVRLARQGRAVPVVISPSGELGLTPEQAVQPEENSQRVKVFRVVADGVPVTVTTLFRLEVSGLARSLTLETAVPPGAVPLAVRAPVAARLGPDGSLVLDAGPGRFEVEVVSRYPGPVARIGPLAGVYGREIWSFQAAPNRREARAEGPPAIDPRTADVPAAWQGLPAFALTKGQSLDIRELGRGAPKGRDALRLTRELWLDFSGKGLSVRDTVSGENRSQWTLAMLPPGELGRVTLAGRDQPVVQVDAGRARGVELRSSRLALTAFSRYPEASALLPAGGFDREFEGIHATLHLPPGWGLLTAWGPDEVRGGLLSPWSLLDVFLVFVLAVAAVTLRGMAAGTALGLFLLLSWHEPGAPTVTWIFVLAGLGLLRLAGESGRLAGSPAFGRFARLFWGLSLLVLLVLAIPFVGGQLRQAVAPQIAPPAGPGEGVAPPVAAPREAVPAAANAPRPLLKQKMAVNAQDGAAGGEADARERLEFDPNALVATGPAMPQWRFASVALTWKGPVTQGQTLRLLLVSPLASTLLGLARVALLGLALLLLVGRNRMRRPGQPVTAVLVAVFLVLATVSASRAGDFPDKDLLDALRQHLTEPARCLPHCLGSPGLDVRMEDGRLTVTSAVDAATRIVAPLPVFSEGWRPDTVSLDGGAATGLVRTGDGLKVLLEAGNHQIMLSGPAPAAVSFTITPALAPQQVRVTAPGYRAQGIDERGQLRGALELTRAAPSGAAVPAAGQGATDIPPFFEIRRELHFGLTWEVVTQVLRRSPLAVSAVASVPLLPGERPDAPGIEARGARAEVAFAPGLDRVSWRSRLTPQPELALAAPTGQGLVESWSLSAAPFYDVTYAGLPPAGIVSAAGQWQPRFAPWPGEVLTVRVSRPKAAPGEFLTVEQANLAVRQGQAMRESNLSLTFRAAKGTRHVLRLPAGAEVTHLAVAGRETLPTGKGGEVGFSLPPGVTEVSLRFREPIGTQWVLRTPAPDLGGLAATVHTRLSLPPGRWLVATFAPTRLGPAVLYWGWLAVVLTLGLGLSTLPDTPLSRWQWLLYALGLSQASPLAFVLAAGWLAALAWRRRLSPQKAWGFDAVQILLVLLTLAGLAALYDTLDAGLLGLPRMQVAGGGSTASELVWTWDQVTGVVPAAVVVSAPLAVFRGLMLVWAVWLAWLLPRLLRWGFDSLTAGGGWRPVRFSLRRPGRRDVEAGTKEV